MVVPYEGQHQPVDVERRGQGPGRVVGARVVADRTEAVAGHIQTRPRKLTHGAADHAESHLYMRSWSDFTSLAYNLGNEVKNPYQANPDDVWLVQEGLFESTYQVIP